jgi:hypothetical protein
MSDFSPYDAFDRVLRRWWLLALCMLIGGLLGWGISLLVPPIYQARANYQVVMDTDQLARLKGLAGAEDLPFSEINPYYVAVEEIFYDLATRKVVVEQAQAAGIDLKLTDFDQSKFFVDRQGSRWLILVRHTDPKAAAWLVNTWLTVADGRIREAQAHGIQAEALRLKVDSVQACFSQFDFAAANQCAGMSLSSPGDLTTFLQNTMAQQQSQANLSLGVDPLLTFTIQREATPPQQPSLQVRSQMALAGALAGLILGTLLVQFLPERTPRHE